MEPGYVQKWQFVQATVGFGPMTKPQELIMEKLKQAERDLEHDSRLLLFDGHGGRRDLSRVHTDGSCDTCNRREPVLDIRWGDE